ncbi:hypothetical protein [Xylanimonas ulmi]|uniref:Uncharacterized protein n=1 Tax=Xylanimonas ulmi TaxID=228973 RepID=A0A4Q7M4Y8_9MICO|nr:hypothetical protein [Xylanibacterium ulmi]RZS62461.1 hypothetical protein EV386_2794 [Xylanibacterium ulmi]
MFELTLLVLGSGLLIGTWGVALWGSAKGTSLLADLLAIVLAFGMLAYLWSPAPTPVAWARSHGWIASEPGGLAVAAGVLATAAVVIFIARRIGLIEGLAKRLSRAATGEEEEPRH